MGEPGAPVVRLAAAPDLETWAVATFDVSAFVLVAVLVGHASGVLADVLPGAGTLPGVLAFVYLWALGVVAVDWALPDEGLAGAGVLALRRLAARGAAAGGAVGTGFLAAPLAVFAASGFLAEGGDPLPFLAILVVGSLVAGLVGAVVGLAFVLVDVALFRASDLLLSDSV